MASARPAFSRAGHELGFVAETEFTFPRITYWRSTARESLTSDG